MTLAMKRIEVLQKIDRLYPRRCEKCRSGIILCDCEISTEIRKLGDELMQLIRPREHDKILDSLNSINDLTTEKYLLLKDLEMTDRTISDKIKMHTLDFAEWKRQNNIVSKGRNVYVKSG